MISTYLSYNLVTRDIGKSLTRYEQQPMVAREAQYYKENIGKITSIEEFVDDTRLFNFAMKAYGLEDMAYAKAFMVKALKEGVEDKDSFANKMTDKRYANFVEAFNFAKHGANATTYNPALHETVEKFTIRATLDGLIPESESAKAETAYFRENIGKVTSIDDLLKNDRLFNYATRAFKLDTTTTPDKKFIREILEGGVEDPDSLANRQKDKSYAAFAAAFNFAAMGEKTTTYTPAFDDAIAGYMRQGLETQAGEQNEAVRLALYFERMAPEITSVYQILGDPALAAVARTVLSLPDSIAQADVDRQAAMLENRLKLEDFQDPEALQKFLQRFAVMWDVSNSPSVAMSPALALFAQPAEMGISYDTMITIAQLKR